MNGRKIRALWRITLIAYVLFPIILVSTPVFLLIHFVFGDEGETKDGFIMLQAVVEMADDHWKTLMEK